MRNVPCLLEQMLLHDPHGNKDSTWESGLSYCSSLISETDSTFLLEKMKLSEIFIKERRWEGGTEGRGRKWEEERERGERGKWGRERRRGRERMRGRQKENKEE